MKKAVLSKSKGLLKVIFIFVGLMMVFESPAQDSDPVVIPPQKDTTYWTKGGLFGVTFTQINLSNWAAGGQNSLALNTLVNLYANYKKNRTTWDNTLDMGYGIFNQARLPWWEKSDDKIDFSSKIGTLAFDSVWFYSALLNFKTQFSPGYDVTGMPIEQRKFISDFMAPGYFILALGLNYKPNPNFDLLIAPLTGKATVVNNQTLADQGAFGVDKAITDANGVIIPGTGKTHRQELGGYVKLLWKFKIMENVAATTKLDLFSNYLHNPQNIDVNWDVLISMKINKAISATLNTTLIYDDDIDIARDPDENGVATRVGPITQFKEVFSLGINYKFKNR